MKFLTLIFLIFSFVLCLSCKAETEIKTLETVPDEYLVYITIIGIDNGFIVLNETTKNEIPDRDVFPDQDGGSQQEYITKNRDSVKIEMQFPTKKKYFIATKHELNTKYADESFIVLSRVGFNPARNKAMVYMSSHCGHECGFGTYYLLARDEKGWKILKEQEVWVM